LGEVRHLPCPERLLGAGLRVVDDDAAAPTVVHPEWRSEPGEDKHFHYHCHGLIDFEFGMRKYRGPDVVERVKANVHPLDPVFKLAEDHGIVHLNGSCIDAPAWSACVSFANLPDHVCDDIGRAIRSVAAGYKVDFEASGKA
jgi:hypothetical protein